MSNTPHVSETDTLAGRQQVMSGVTQVGDTLVGVESSVVIRDISPGERWVGLNIAEGTTISPVLATRWRVYRKGGPPKPGDLDINPSTGRTFGEDPAPVGPHHSEPGARVNEKYPEPMVRDAKLAATGTPSPKNGTKELEAIIEKARCAEAITEKSVALPTEAKARKGIPIATGFIDYFPDAIAEVARLSWIGNQQHHPDKPLHWDKTKSTDEADALMRHFIDRGTLDTDGVRHSAKVAWRAMALLQRELDAARANGGAK